MKEYFSIDNNNKVFIQSFEIGKQPDGFFEFIPNEITSSAICLMYDLENNVFYEGATQEEITSINENTLALFSEYPELEGLNFKLLQLDNLEMIEREVALSNKGLKGEKKYYRNGKLIWSSQKKYWFEQDSDYKDGFIRTIKLFSLSQKILHQWEVRVKLSLDDRQLFLKQQRELIFEYFKSQQPELFNFLYAFFSKEINDYIMADGETLRNTLIDAAENHPYQNAENIYIVRVTLNQEIPTQTPGVTTTVLQGIIDELI